MMVGCTAQQSKANWTLNSTTHFYADLQLCHIFLLSFYDCRCSQKGSHKDQGQQGGPHCGDKGYCSARPVLVYKSS